MHILYAYIAYFSVLYVCAVLWTYDYLVTSGALAITVVTLHFIFGGLKLWYSGTSAGQRLAFALKRYTQPLNFTADALLLASLVVLALSLRDNNAEMLYIGVGVATAGNSLCILTNVDPESVIAMKAESRSRAGSNFYLF